MIYEFQSHYMTQGGTHSLILGALKDIALGCIFRGRRTYLLKLICRAERCVRADGTNAVTAVSRVSNRTTLTMAKNDFVNLSRNLVKSSSNTGA